MNMKQLRTIILLGIVFVGYLLFMAWEQDHQSMAQKIQPKAIPTQTLLGNQATTPTQKNIPKIAIKTLTKASNELIHVQTDVFDLVIDPQGGNIVRSNLLNYSQTTQPDSKPIALLNNQPDDLYINESGLLSQMGPDNTSKQATYRSAQKQYVLQKGQDSLSVPLVWQSPDHVTVTKTFIFKRNDYQINVAYEVNNQSNKNWSGQSYLQFKRKKPESTSGFFGFSTYTGGAISTDEKPFEKINFDDMAKQNLDEVTKSGWVAMVQQYFIAAAIPPAKQNNRYYTIDDGDDIYTLGTIGPVYNVGPGEKYTIANKIYVGPLDTAILKKVAPHLELTVDYGWFWYISSALFYLMKFIYSYVGNWGWAIVWLTVLCKIVLYHPSAATYRSAIRMRHLQPKIQALKDRFKDDRMGLQKSIAELYKTEKVNPLGGCLPLLLQLPVFIALYWVIIESVELRHAPFVLWIQDLSAKDPYYVLPALMCITMFIQQRLSPPPTDPMQAKVMYLMPIFFTFLLINFPAGLVLYWVVNNVLSILQQWFVNETYSGNNKTEKNSLSKKIKLFAKKD